MQISTCENAHPQWAVYFTCHFYSLKAVHVMSQRTPTQSSAYVLLGSARGYESHGHSERWAESNLRFMFSQSTRQCSRKPKSFYPRAQNRVRKALKSLQGRCFNFAASQPTYIFTMFYHATRMEKSCTCSRVTKLVLKHWMLSVAIRDVTKSTDSRSLWCFQLSISVRRKRHVRARAWETLCAAITSTSSRHFIPAFTPTSVSKEHLTPSLASSTTKRCFLIWSDSHSLYFWLSGHLDEDVHGTKENVTFLNKCSYFFKINK